MFNFLVVAVLSSGLVNSAGIKLSAASIPQDLKNYSSLTQKIPNETCQNPILHKLNLLEVEGVKLNTLLYLQTAQILKESRAAGTPLGITSSFRTCTEQTSLRQLNCPDPANSPAESCTPATEKPGQSLHNYSLAVDFKCDGYSTFGSSPCYTWLTQNAQRFKLKRHASEPWHWSFTGK